MTDDISRPANLAILTQQLRAFAGQAFPGLVILSETNISPSNLTIDIIATDSCVRNLATVRIMVGSLTLLRNRANSPSKSSPPSNPSTSPRSPGTNDGSSGLPANSPPPATSYPSPAASDGSGDDAPTQTQSGPPSPLIPRDPSPI